MQKRANMKFNAQVLFFIELFCIVQFINCAKIIIFVPVMSGSQVVFNYRIGDLLAENGHEVTLYNMIYDLDVKKGKLKSSAKEIFYEALKDPAPYREINKVLDKMSFGTVEFDLNMITKMNQPIIDGCENQISDKGLMKKLKNAKYDLAIAHMYDFCPIGMIKVLEIPTYIWMSSGALMDWMAFSLGSPVPSSYVPNTLSSFGDRMTFSERFQNFLGHLLSVPVMKMFMINPETQLFRKYYDKNFPDLFELSSQAPLAFVNSEELLEFARPILHKIIYIGGIGLKMPNPLDEHWKKILDNSKDGVILFSFGSTANPKEMPNSWKEAFITAFSKFPTYTFVWKYDGEFAAASRAPNIILHNWVPQNDMFGHPKFRAFITHAGLNSLLEASANGIPLVVIPLFGDQASNRLKAERHGIAVGVDKSQVTEKVITDALERILHNSTYKENAERLSRMIRNKPFKAEEIALRWVDFLAEFKELPNLLPVGAELSLVEYFCVDVLASILLGGIIILYIIYRLFCFIYLKTCSSKSEQKNKTE